jgi:thioredoxin-related protein
MSKRWGLFFTGVALIFSLPAFAAPEKPSPVVIPDLKPESQGLYEVKGQPYDPSKIPLLADFIKQGGKFYYIGERSGLQGWFVLTSGGVQVVYLTPDQKTVLAGAMFAADGRNVSVSQMKDLWQAEKSLGDLLNQAGKQQVMAVQAGADKNGVASLDSASVKAPASTLPSVSLSPGNRLMQDLEATAGSVVGTNDKAPLLYMIVSPTCPYCHGTWKELRDDVRKGNLRIKLILISGGEVAKLGMSAALLQAKDPMEAWDKYVEGDKTALLSITPDEAHIRAAMANENLVNRWDIRVTPYLVYRAKDNKVKIIQGRPDRAAAILTDMTP